MQLIRLMQTAGLVFTLAYFSTPTFLFAQKSSSATSIQPPDIPQQRWWHSFMTGMGSVDGGDYRERMKAVIEFAGGVERPVRPNLSHLIGGAVGLVQGAFGHDAVAFCRLQPDGTCLQIRIAPEVPYASLMTGAKFSKGFFNVSGLVGPGIFHPLDDFSGTNGQRHAATVSGVMLRSDAWFRVGPRVSLGGALSSRIIPSYMHHRVSANTWSMGFRVGRPVNQ